MTVCKRRVQLAPLFPGASPGNLGRGSLQDLPSRAGAGAAAAEERRRSNAAASSSQARVRLLMEPFNPGVLWFAMALPFGPLGGCAAVLAGW